ncbi:MAG: cobaltochelatase subunit CobN [Cyanobacteria bacterium RM1_2_2]|nr:cobaltochelatase subunit CobN [Cyanobacteria bacterium RM1_2_2]
MHRLATLPGGWTPETDGVILIDQTPAPLVVMTAADTDIQIIAATLPHLPADFPALRVVNLLQLQQNLTIDTYAEEVLRHAQGIVLRLLGGRAYWSYGLEVVKQIVQETGAALYVLPGDDRPDPDLVSHSTVSLTAVDRLWRYFNEGGVENIAHALSNLANTSLSCSYACEPPVTVPRVGRYLGSEPAEPLEPKAAVGILFYRAHYLAGNTAVIDALCAALAERQLCPIPIFVSSLRDPDVQSELLAYFQAGSEPQATGIQGLLNTTSFSLAKLEAETPQVELWQQLDLPVLQVMLASSTAEQWRDQTRGLSPRDLAMNVALPEVDGRIISRAVSFKAVQTHHPQLETDVVTYLPVADRVQFVADLAANWVRLRQTPNAQKRIALVLANYPTRDGRLANGVGLDTPASCVEILKALQQQGYFLEHIPATGDDLIQRLTQTATNDPEGQWRSVNQSMDGATYQRYFASLPEAVQQGIGERWGWEEMGMVRASIPIAGLQLGNVFVGIQPARGYDLDPALNYHAPDLEPPHAYLAFYEWLRSEFGAQAIVHVGKHGNLEWLPGKGVALSQDCYPEVTLGALPHLYPFIVNDPGEGSQAKRRSQAVILDHLTPPMTRAELYGNLQQLEHLIDEYYEAQNLDPTRLPLIRERLLSLIQQEHFQQELGVDSELKFDAIDGYLCELKEAQIRDGLHIFGQCPEGRQLRDLIVSIARHPGRKRLGLTRAIAQAWKLDIDPLTADLGQPWQAGRTEIAALTGCRTVGDVVEALEQTAADFVESLLQNSPNNAPDPVSGELGWISDTLLPALRQTCQEIDYLLHGLAGGYVPSGAAGAPTRGRPEVLPTGRNFYSVDIRAIPTETSWDVGRKAAEILVEHYVQEQGEYPRTLALSIWGTSTMRTGGDDLAEAFALLGVRPIWDGASRRVVDFEILPLSILGRPRVDVTLRISGFFRDAFPNLIDLFHQAVEAVASLDEPADQNPLAAQVQQDTQTWQAAGLPADQAVQRSQYRIFGSKPGAYGAGLQGLIEAQNWTDDQDLARAYINWSSYAYTGQGDGRSAPEAFEQRLSKLQIVLHNQDNREHDLLDSDDYYQFQGGLTASVRALTGQNPQTYFGDHALPENPKVRHLRQEIARVYRSRVVNPKWIAGVMRHGYKGAFEMAATVDYLFAYDATAQCVEDYMYEGIAQSYLFDATVQEFIQQKNPWALRDMAERLLEANQRGLWQQAQPETLEQLRAMVHQAEATIEGN